MQYAIIIIAVLLILLARMNTQQAKKVPSGKRNTDYSNLYQPKWMFTYNEKDAFQKLKAVTDKYGLYLFAKVRLFDLIEPRKNCGNIKGAQWKIQAKHVDFVICDSKLVARYIIELDDESHDKNERKERDAFVNTVLTKAGYKVLHTRAIEDEKIETFFFPDKRADEKTSQP